MINIAVTLVIELVRKIDFIKFPSLLHINHTNFLLLQNPFVISPSTASKSVFHRYINIYQTECLR